MSVPLSVLLSLYQSERYLEAYLRDVLAQTIAAHVHLIVVHNDPSPEEQAILERWLPKLPGGYTYLSVPREPLYASWNRAVAEAKTPFVCCWNVGDRRTPDSLERMLQTMESNPSALFTYGDIVVVDAPEKRTGRLATYPEWSLEAGTTGAIGGPFFLWRTEAAKRIGPFDEQFRIAADFDYTVRLSLAGSGVKTPGVIGFFLHEGRGLSTRMETLQEVERTVLELRYGIWHKLDLKHLPAAMGYRVYAIRGPEAGWVPIDEAVDAYTDMLQSTLIRLIALPAAQFRHGIIRAARRVKGQLLRMGAKGA